MLGEPKKQLTWHVCVIGPLESMSCLCGRTMALDSRCVPSGETRRPVTVLAWPFSVIATSAFRRSHTWRASTVSEGQSNYQSIQQNTNLSFLTRHTHHTPQVRWNSQIACSALAHTLYINTTRHSHVHHTTHISYMLPAHLYDVLHAGNIDLVARMRKCHRHHLTRGEVLSRDNVHADTYLCSIKHVL